jgi:hypothetical protein
MSAAHVNRFDHRFGERRAVHLEKVFDLIKVAGESLCACAQALGTNSLGLRIFVTPCGRLGNAISAQAERVRERICQLDARLTARTDCGHRTDLCNGCHRGLEIASVLRHADEIDFLTVGDEVAKRLGAYVAPHAADAHGSCIRRKRERHASRDRVDHHEHGRSVGVSAEHGRCGRSRVGSRHTVVSDELARVHRVFQWRRAPLVRASHRTSPRML